MNGQPRGAIGTALFLALGAAVSLGLARFAYALLLPPMRADLGWSYLTGGAMNTANAAGYLVGALAMPRLLAQGDARRWLLAGSAATGGFMALHGLVAGDAALYALRLLAGIASAAVFVSGGLMAARLGAASPNPSLVLGIYYGGTGAGIVASALLVPPALAHAGGHAWQRGWLVLAVVALAATAAMARGAPRSLPPAPGTAADAGAVFRWRDFGFGLAGYTMFGLGYIGYMTFVITLLREQQVAPVLVIAFYVLLGVGVMASPWLWAGLLARQRGGRALALLNALLALATVLPVASRATPAVFASGALFGAVFLSVVASTTALVRHNLPPAAWSRGIGAFTVVFAGGQIVGPTLVGWLSDGTGGLRAGLAGSAAMLLAGALLALGQRPLR